MSIVLSRRHLLQASAVAAASGVAPLAPRSALAQTPTQIQTAAPTILTAMTRVLEVKGKPATVLGIEQAGGLSGLFLDPGQRFNVQLVNKLKEETIVHWHGQTPPVAQDGVAMTGEEKTIQPGATKTYDYAPRVGTHWMHSHQGMQEMQLLAGPLIVRSAEDVKQDAQEVTLMLHDFTFKSPEEVMKTVTGGSMVSMGSGSGGAAAPAPATPPAMAGMPGMSGMSGMSGGSGKPAAGQLPMQMGGGSQPDLNDFDFDAYLANDRTLDDPMVVRMERRGRVRLRIINGASSTVFWIDLGAVEGTVIAVDGAPVRPVRGRRFPIAMAQRLDIMLDVAPGTVVPVLAQREGDRVRTGLILAAPGANVAKIAELAAKPSEAMGLSLESQLRALTPLAPRRADRELQVVLGGGMSPYKWSINGRGWEDRQPLQISKGQRVVFNIVNQTPMGHPMHLHGHVFQVIELNGKALSGAERDTLQVPGKSSAMIAFDADNPGRWVFHCHNLLHMETGMITEVVYGT